jgi:hypothetical protein
MKLPIHLLAAALILDGVCFAQAPKAAADTAVSNKETQVTRFYVNMAAAAEGQNLGKTAVVGSRYGTPFSEAVKGGGVLVGMEVWGGPSVRGVQAIFETPTGRVRGQKHGWCRGPSSVLEAKEGFAVTGLNANGADGFEVIFMRIHHSSSSLDAVGTYKSEWVGSKYTKPTRLVPNQKPIIGIYGTTDATLNGIGFLYYDRK